jgi:hypothetical protein
MHFNFFFFLMLIINQFNLISSNDSTTNLGWFKRIYNWSKENAGKVTSFGGTALNIVATNPIAAIGITAGAATIAGTLYLYNKFKKKTQNKEQRLDPDNNIIKTKTEKPIEEKTISNIKIQNNMPTKINTDKKENTQDKNIKSLNKLTKNENINKIETQIKISQNKNFQEKSKKFLNKKIGKKFIQNNIFNRNKNIRKFRKLNFKNKKIHKLLIKNRNLTF